MTTQFKLTLIWLAGATIALISAFDWMAASYVGGEYVPVGHDSFYHARRILDAIADPSHFYQFDPLIHAPEGSWLVWPWAYDRGMAWLARLAMQITGVTDPMSVLAYIPPACVYINAGLLLLVASSLGLPLWLRAVAVGCFSLSPMTQALHAVGMLDHHFIELTAVLLTLWTGLRWLQQPGAWRWPIALGATLGAAPAFQNGLFILQVPVLATLLVLWIRRLPLPATIPALGATLIAIQVAVLLPSEPFWHGQFSFYTLSWFHLYAAGSTALFLVLLYRLKYSARNMLLLTAAALLLGAIALPQVQHGGQFLMARISKLGAIAETQSLPSELRQGRADQLYGLYSGFLFVLPLVLLWQVAEVFRSKEPAWVFFGVSTVLGGLLLISQYRFYPFGAFALYLPLLVLLARWLPSLRPRRRRVTIGAAGLVLVGAYLGPWQYLSQPRTLGNDVNYALARNAFLAMANACAQRPGVVLADHGDGHYIRYHTECAVIANNMIITPLHEEKVKQAAELLAMSPGELRRKAPWIDYVCVRWGHAIFNPATHDQTMRRHTADMQSLLLIDKDAFPDGFELLDEARVTRSDGRELPYLRFFRVHHSDRAR
jgi:hypothetical protein